jgi:pimeloyl-ACP methyl ester carboxylesterase
MKRIGYNSYVICGGDWGSVIGTHMAQIYPNYVRGLLITFIPPIRSLKHDIQSLIGHYINPSFILDSDEQEFLRNRFDAFEYFKFFW